jgi:predicted dehydrogenase
MTTRWGILGCARIALGHVVPAMAAVDGAVPAAIAGRDPERTARAADRLGIPRHHTSYADLLDDPGIDAVYLPLPPHLHHRWALRALRSGKSVLVEKPAVGTAAEADELVAEARRRDLLLVEATMYRFREQWASLRAWREQHAPPGTPALLRAHIGYTLDAPADDHRRSRSSGGGALRDLGTYAVNAASALFGAAERGWLAQVRDGRAGTDADIDLVSAGGLVFPDGRVLAFDCDFRHAWVDTPLELRTPGGTAVLDHAFNPGTHPTELRVLRQGAPPETRPFAGADAYAAMVAEFGRWRGKGASSDFAAAEAHLLTTTARNTELLTSFESRGASGPA